MYQQGGQGHVQQNPAGNAPPFQGQAQQGQFQGHPQHQHFQMQPPHGGFNPGMQPPSQNPQQPNMQQHMPQQQNNMYQQQQGAMMNQQMNFAPPQEGPGFQQQPPPQQQPRPAEVVIPPMINPLNGKLLKRFIVEEPAPTPAPTPQAEPSSDTKPNCGCKRLKVKEHVCSAQCKDFMNCDGSCGPDKKTAAKPARAKPGTRQPPQPLAPKPATQGPQGPQAPQVPVVPEASQQVPSGEAQPMMSQAQMSPHAYLAQMNHTADSPTVPTPQMQQQMQMQQQRQLNHTAQPFQPSATPSKKIEIKAPPPIYNFEQIKEMQNDVLQDSSRSEKIPQLWKFVQENQHRWKNHGPVPAESTSNILSEMRSSASNADKMKRKLINLLNKLTPEKYESLCKKVFEVLDEVKEADQVEGEYTEDGVVSDLYGMAVKKVTKPYRDLYAQLCYDISNNQAKQTNLPIGRTSFRRVLVNKCQMEFEQLQEDSKQRHIFKTEGGTRTPQEEKAVNEQRSRAVGNIQFVGELFKKQMITEKIMHTLLRNFFSQTQLDEEQLETFTELMKTVGKQLDTEKAVTYMDFYIQRFRELLQPDNGYSTRVKVLITNIIELREERGWEPRIVAEMPSVLGENSQQIAAQPNHYAQGSMYTNMMQRGASIHPLQQKPPPTAQPQQQQQGFPNAQPMWKRNASPQQTFDPQAQAQEHVEKLQVEQDQLNATCSMLTSSQDSRKTEFAKLLIIASSQEERFDLARTRVASALARSAIRVPEVIKLATTEIYEHNLPASHPQIWRCFSSCLKELVEQHPVPPELAADVLCECVRNVSGDNVVGQLIPAIEALNFAQVPPRAACLFALIDSSFLINTFQADKSAGVDCDLSMAVGKILFSQAEPDQQFTKIKTLNADLSAVTSAILAYLWVDAISQQAGVWDMDTKTKELVKKLLLYHRDMDRRKNMTPAIDTMKGFMRLARWWDKEREHSWLHWANTICHTILAFSDQQGLMAGENVDDLITGSLEY